MIVNVCFVLSDLNDTRQIQGGRKRLFIRDILQSHISRWIVEVVKSAYLTHDQVPQERVTAHALRALSSSWAYNCHIALEDVMSAAFVSGVLL